MATTTEIERDVPTANLLATTKTGRTDRQVVVGAHLDSVPAGPGINDNGSGSSQNLEIALQMAKLDVTPTNQVVFAWWGAEEPGLIGSQFYVDSLTARQVKDTAVNLNFDMVGSPNFVRFVYDGDASDTDSLASTGSGVVEDVFLDYFASQRLPVEPTAFDGRSDYDAFISVGIPAGGIFTGAEEIKTPAQVAIYGGTAGVAYDPCYHQACDTTANLSKRRSTRCRTPRRTRSSCSPRPPRRSRAPTRARARPSKPSSRARYSGSSVGSPWHDEGPATAGPSRF